MYNAFNTFTREDQAVEFRKIAKNIPGMNTENANKVVEVLLFLDRHPAFINGNRGGRPNILVEHGVKQVMGKWLQGRKRIKALPTAKTIPDPAVRAAMVASGMPQKNMDVAIWHHYVAMAAENVIGSLLEEYIADHLEPQGWIWCSGETVKSIDFIKPVDGDWQTLQVKNRSNSENSSSAAVRDGTEIIKWHRINAYTAYTHWKDLPDNNGMTEKGFQEYIRRALR